MAGIEQLYNMNNSVAVLYNIPAYRNDYVEQRPPVAIDEDGRTRRGYYVHLRMFHHTAPFPLRSRLKHD